MSSPKKRGEGTSCHHCKKRIRPNEMLKCTRGEIVPTNSRKRKRPCVKKYCLHCIKTFYSNQYLDDNSSGSFICPACRDECRCAACRRRVMKARLKNDGSALENEADGQANSILESQTPDATNIEEGQVNGLLEILDSRPDVQDIIRRGMAMDFADDNAKILYVGHLIDQALTRPDVLALYYASSHGRANNCRIKTEIKQNGVDSNDLPPETPTTMDIEHISSSTSISASPNHHHRNKRKRRNHNKHKKHHNTHSVFGNGMRNTRHAMSSHTPLMHTTHAHGMPTAVKQEPLMVNTNNAQHTLLNGISAPQPATISLSGGNPMNFVNSMSFPPPLNIPPPHGPHLSGIPPNLPPINIPFPIHENRHNKMPQIPLNIAQSIHHNHHNTNGNNQTNGAEGDTQAGVPPPPSSSGNENGNYNNNNNDGSNGASNNGIFPINVTPSVMMGGPPLASM